MEANVHILCKNTKSEAGHRSRESPRCGEDAAMAPAGDHTVVPTFKTPNVSMWVTATLTAWTQPLLQPVGAGSTSSPTTSNLNGSSGTAPFLMASAMSSKSSSNVRYASEPPGAPIASQ